ncbi:methylated-DNA--[protein]-cysteine S-methyltransferase [Tautonia sp. JC769]|uniref:methylated-DNA--[protein]-cysteine S-methyltransferase n=1 Tax=Tautonia sp. JC769 TaxID=3232135 RepID=UPI003459A3AE
MTTIEDHTLDSRNPIVLTSRRIDTPIGPMRAGASDQGLALLEFAEHDLPGNERRAMGQGRTVLLEDGDHPLLERLSRELADYFEGRRNAFTLPLTFIGTPFERDAWEALRTIPFGETRTYAEQARSMGRATAVRAVGRANGRNRLAIVVPCHRVIASGGRLCGYNGGLWRKQFLIELEARHAPGAPAQAGACCS